MIDALTKLWTASPGWAAAGVGTIGVLLVLVGLSTWLLQRRVVQQKKGTPASAGAAPPASPVPLTRVWGSFVRGLHRTVRAAPITFVLGERRAGKTALLTAARRGRLVNTSNTFDSRLGLYFGDDQMVEEVAGDLLEDARTQSRADLDALFRKVAWQTPLVVVVLNPSLPSWRAPAGLHDLGRIVRAKVDFLTNARQSPVRVRVCLTHVDEVAGAGLADLVSRLPRAGGAMDGADAYLPLQPSSTSALDLARSLDSLSPYVTYGLQAPGFADVVGFFSPEGGARSLLEDLAPFLGSLIDGKTGVKAPVLDGIFLAALPEGGPPTLSGDPFALDEKIGADVATQVGNVNKTRRRAALATGVLGAALLAALFASHGFFTKRAVDAAANFKKRAAASDERTVTSASEMEQTEATAGRLVTNVADTTLPLRAAYPQAKQKAVADLLEGIRDYYLLPIALQKNPEKRIYAMSLLYASVDDRIGQSIYGHEATWATRLGVPTQVVSDYLALSKSRWKGPGEPLKLPPLDPPGIGATLEGWSDYLSRLTAALDAPILTPDKLGPLVRDAENLSAYVRGPATSEQLLTLTSVLRGDGLDVDTWFGPTVSQSDVPEWVNGYRNELAAVLTLVRQTSLKGPDAHGKTLAQALEDLRSLIPPPLAGSAPTPSGPGVPLDAGTASDAGATGSAGLAAASPAPLAYTFVLPGGPFTISPSRWHALVLSSRAVSYVRTFEDDTAHRSPFFGPVAPCTGMVGEPIVLGRGPTTMISCQYSSTVFSADVALPLAALDATLDLVALPRADQDTLKAQILRASRDYGAAYRASLLTYYQSYRLTPSTPAALDADLGDMLSPGSFLTEFLKIVAKTADLGPQDGPYLEAIGDSVADFAPIVAVMSGTPGKYPALEKYYALLAPMLASLAPALPGPPPPPGSPLDERLSPVGKLGMVMIAGGDGSPYAAVQAWLDEQHMPPSLRAPFVAPVSLAYDFGLHSVGQTVQAAYASEILPTVQPLLARFPFDRTSDVDAVGADVQAVFGPKGSFSQSFQKLIAPVCADDGAGRWTPRTTPFGPVPVPTEALQLARRAGMLATMLWGDDGKPKPITFMVRPLPLPAVGLMRSITLSSVRAGTTSVFGFNQTPSWQPLPVEWAAADTASVSLRSTATGGGDDRYQSVDIGPSEWSFHRLLLKGQATGSVVSWSFPSGSGGPPPRVVSFGFQGDPWAPFSPPNGS